MSTVTENDIKRLEDLINNRFDRLEVGQKTLEKGQIEIKERLAVIETRQEDWKPSIDKISDLAEKVGELKNWRQIVIITITASIRGFVGWVIREGTLKP